MSFHEPQGKTLHCTRQSSIYHAKKTLYQKPSNYRASIYVENEDINIHDMMDSKMNYRSNQKRLWKNLNNSTTGKNKTTTNTYLPQLMLFIMKKYFTWEAGQCPCCTTTISALTLGTHRGSCLEDGRWEELPPIRPYFSKWGPGTICTTVTLDAGLKYDLWSSGFSPNMLPPDPKHSLTFQGDPQPPHQSRQTSHALSFSRCMSTCYE